MIGPVIWKRSLQLPPPMPDDKRADLERLLDTLGQEVKVSLPLLRQLPHALREKDFNVNIVLARNLKGLSLLKINHQGRLYAVAIDVGSTNIVATLWDLEVARQIAREALKNPQFFYGADIMTRMHMAMSGNLRELSDALLRGINELLERLASSAGIRTEDILYCSVCGNTVMSHFLLGLPVDNIPVEPYIPVLHRPGTFMASELGLKVFPEAPVYVFPNVGSYVGGDILAGIIATGLHCSEMPQVLLDIGTNGEVVIGTRDWIFVGSGAAGPALEAGVLEAGMEAREGAIYRVDLKEDRFHFKSIGDRTPVGICGSGLVDLVAELYREGWIDPYGRFTEKAILKEIDGEKAVVVTEGETGPILIREREIENFLRSKAGMFTTLYVMVTDLGLSFSDIERFYIAGAMGSGVRVDRAKVLGMLPDLPEQKIQAVGNSALKGAEALLKDHGLIDEIEELRKKVTYKEMNADASFMSLFRSAMVIPHADPSVLRCDN